MVEAIKTYLMEASKPPSCYVSNAIESSKNFCETEKCVTDVNTTCGTAIMKSTENVDSSDIGSVTGENIQDDDMSSSAKRQKIYASPPPERFDQGVIN